MKRLLGLIVGLIFALPSMAATLPSGYTELEYVTATNAVVSSNISIASNHTLTLDFDMAFASTSDSQLIGIFGGIYFGPYSGTFGIGNRATNMQADTKRHRFVLSGIADKSDTELTLLVDSTTLSTTRSTVSGSVGLLGLNQNGSYAVSGTIYSAKIYDNGELKGYFIPAKYGNKVGFYNTVTNTFLEPYDGTLTAGPEADPCKNLFDVNNVEIQNNTAIGSDGSLATNGAVNTCVTYIPVQPNTTYTISGNALSSQVSGSNGIAYFRLAQYNSSKQFISRSDGVEGTSYTFTTGANTYYIRFHYANADADLRTYQLKLSSCNTFVETPNVCASFDVEKVYKVGTPTITNTGVYTTNASTSFIRTQGDVNFSNANFWSFKWRFTYHPSSTDQGIMSGDGGTNIQAIINSEGRPRFSFGSTRDTWDIGAWNDSSISFRYQDGVTYDNEIYFNGTRYGYKVDGVEIGGLDSIKKAANTYFAIGVERQRTANQYTHSEWDLTHTTLTVNGVEQLAWCISPIKIATTKYNNTAFGPVVTALNNAVDTIKTVVANTINQATAVANLHSGKQTMPDSTATNGTCPNYRQCLLVEDEQGAPYWYVILDPFNDLINPILTGNLNGNTATYNVGYTQLEYIESNGTQYIDTGITASSSKYKVETRFAAVSGKGAILGNQTGDALLYLNDSGKLVVYSNNAAKQTFSTDSNPHTVVLEYNGTNVTISGDYSYEFETDWNPTQKIDLFANNYNGNPIDKGNVRIYSAKFWNNGTLVRDMVPVRQNSTGKFGMYDKVNNVFYGNANTASGATDFTPGRMVTNDTGILGMNWGVHWNNPNGDVVGETMCISSGSNANDRTLGNACWCKMTGMVLDRQTYAANGAWVNIGTYSTAPCYDRCADACAQQVKTNATNRTAILTVQ